MRCGRGGAAQSSSAMSTRLTLPAASRSSSARSAGGQHLGQRHGGQRPLLAGHHHGRVAGGDHRGQDADQAEEAGAGRGQHGHHAGRLGHAEVEVGPGHRVRRPGHLGDLVRPARVPDPPVDRRGDRAGRGLAARPLGAGDLGGELGGPALQHLGHPVQHLAAVVGGRRGPLGGRGPGRHHGVPGVLARGPGSVREQVPARRADRVGPAGLRPRERAADEQLVGLPHAEPPVRRVSRLAVRHRGTRPARAGRPPARSRTHRSRRTGWPGRTG